MKNIQVIYGAQNCAFSVYSADEDDFAIIFAMPGQDVEFVEDIIKRLRNDIAGDLVNRVTKNPIEKPELDGLHGTLFFGLLERKQWYPNKRENDLDRPNLSELLKRL